jgi:hypothetical protein
MSPYKVMLDDNFHYMEEDERREYGTFASAEEAVEACRRLVDESLVSKYSAGASADALYAQYQDFGDDPFIVATDGAAKVEFSAWNYARERVQALAAPGAAGERERLAVRDRERVTRGNP